MILTGDIGGTKTNIAIISPDAGPRQTLVTKTYASDEYDSLETIITEFLREQSEDDNGLHRACFGVAGPVIKGHAKTTNLPWEIDEKRIAKKCGVSNVKLLNDLEAAAYGILSLKKEDIVTLNKGKPAQEGVIAVIAPGTGLGEAFLAWDRDSYRAYPTEGGHTDFGPQNEREIELLRYLMKSHKHVSYEWVCSGIGIPNIYNFLRDSGYAEEPEWLARALAHTDDPTPQISNAAYKQDDPVDLCVQTMEMFVSILGAEAGNLALKTLPTGGVYIGGGIPPRMLRPLQEGQFMKAFLSKGRFNSLLESLPVHVILNPQTALIGASYYALERMV
jgi:glucokinase